jgi:hypothetical protein
MGMSKSLRPLTPELQQAFYQAVMECKGWQADPEEPEVYVYDQIHRIKISSVCNDVIACENKPMPEETLGALARIPDQTRTDLTKRLGRDGSYHAGAYVLAELIRDKKRKHRTTG